jgi:hypothetical protein
MPAGAWTEDELHRVGEAEELEMSSVRADDTLPRPVVMWVVRHGDDIYARSVNGRDSSWFRHVQTKHEARIDAGGFEKDVSLVETDELLDEIDADYRAKYGRYGGPTARITSVEARAAQLKLVPR